MPLSTCRNSKSSLTPPNTTRPARRRAARSAMRASGGIGSVTGAGICHAYTPDGRCVSLLKILLTNFCIYDCAYCVSRALEQRAARAFHRRRGGARSRSISTGATASKGLFLSSGIARSRGRHDGRSGARGAGAARDHGFRGYIHLKTIPGASEDLIAQAGRYADRLSMNVELPTDDGAADFAPEKNAERTSARDWRRRARRSKPRRRTTKRQRARSQGNAPRFAPAGQSTQMIVGADATPDAGHPQRSRARSMRPMR